MMEHIKPEDFLKQTVNVDREKARLDNIAKTSDQFHYGPGPGLVEYIREARHLSEGEESNYNITPLLWELAGINPDPAQVFEKFKTKNNSTLKEALKASTDWANFKGQPLLTIAGNPGVGKTFLAIATAQTILSKYGLVMYRTVEGLLQEYKRDTFGNRHQGFEIDLKAVTSLIIDDFGREQKTDWSDPFLDSLVDFRYSRKARLMICTNAKSGELSPRVADRLGDRTIGKVVQIDAPSHRTGK